VAVAFRLSQPALVAVAGGPAAPLAAGDHRVEVPGGPEARTVALTADAGGGRTAAASVDVAAVAPPEAGPAATLALAPPAAVPTSGDDPTAFGLVAPSAARADASGRSGRWVAVPAALLLASLGWAVRRGRRRSGRPAG
jgi:hypothetical protein